MKQLKSMLLIALIGFSAIYAHAEEKHHSHEHRTAKLTLNNGGKWLADTSTKESAKKIQAALELFSREKQGRSAEEYNLLGQNLRTLLGEMIQGCKMQGGAHEQLHVWITNISPAIDALAKAKTASSGREAHSHLVSIVAEFEKYFE